MDPWKCAQLFLREINFFNFLVKYESVYFGDICLLLYVLFDVYIDMIWIK